MFIGSQFHFYNLQKLNYAFHYHEQNRCWSDVNFMLSWTTHLSGIF